MGRCARSPQKRRAHFGRARSALSLALGVWLSVQSGSAQAPAEPLPAGADLPVVEEPTETTTAPAKAPSSPAKAAGTPRPLTARPAASASAAEPQPLAADVENGLAVRIEALEALAKGTLPERALDSVLSVSLDDDSSMIERDVEARAEHRRLTVALNQAERAQSKSEAELQQMRDQILALELERKVLSLPIEVRERLVQETYEASAPKPTEPAGIKQEAAKPIAVAPPPAARPAQSNGASAKAKAQTRHERTWPSGWPLFVALLLVTFVASRVVGALAAKRPHGMVDARREQSGGVIQLGICSVGFAAALLMSFRLPPEIAALMLGALLLFAVLAGKDIAASLFGGLVLFFQSPFRVGHRIEIAGVEGRVIKMGLLFVRVVSAQQRTIDIPNSEFLSKHVSASSASAMLLPLQVDFYIKPQDDIAHAKSMIEDVVQNTPGVDTSEGQNGIFVSQVPLSGTPMVRLRAKVFFTGARPEQELASEISERVIERLRAGVGAPVRSEAEASDHDRGRSATRSTAH